MLKSLSSSDGVLLFTATAINQRNKIWRFSYMQRERERERACVFLLDFCWCSGRDTLKTSREEITQPRELTQSPAATERENKSIREFTSHTLNMFLLCCVRAFTIWWLFHETVPPVMTNQVRGALKTRENFEKIYKHPEHPMKDFESFPSEYLPWRLLSLTSGWEVRRTRPLLKEH